MFITNINEDRILFDNGSYITFEDNIKAPFVVRADNYPALDLLNIYANALTQNFQEPLNFKKGALGFYLGDNNCSYFIPCYSVQNVRENEDPSDNTINIIYVRKGVIEVVLEEVFCAITKGEE